MGNKPKFRVVLTGGGTGGHIFPLIAVARELKKICVEKSISLDLIYVGPYDFFSKSLAQEGIVVKPVISGKFRRYWSFANFLSPIFLFIGFFQSLWHLWLSMPDVVFSKGGYGALPVIWTSFLYRIPVFIHESDTIPGLTNQISAKTAKRIAVSFNSTFKYFPEDKTAVTGNPIRKSIFDFTKSSDESKKAIGLKPEIPVVLVLGGSQGAGQINDLILDILPRLLVKYQILHQTGERNYRQVEKESNVLFRATGEQLHNRYIITPFLDENSKGVREINIRDAYNACDIVISRSGSGSIFEIAMLGKPSILIPLSNSARNHQKYNAFEYGKHGGAIVLEQENLKPDIILNEITKILDSQDVYKKMSESAKSFSKPESAEVLAKEIIKFRYNL